MITKGKIYDCDFTGKKFPEGADGYHIWARGATGRVCEVMHASEDAFTEGKLSGKISTFEELEKWAESEPGGYVG